MWQFEVFKDEDGDWRWRLVLRNTLVAFESPAFDRRALAKAAAETARAEIGSAIVREL